MKKLLTLLLLSNVFTACTTTERKDLYKVGDCFKLKTQGQSVDGSVVDKGMLYYVLSIELPENVSPVPLILAAPKLEFETSNYVIPDMCKIKK